jgi:hypothetical protein
VHHDADAHELCGEPLLLPALIEAHKGNAAGDGAILEIVRGLMDSPRTDAQRVGERLSVFGWQVDGPGNTMRWVYRVVGEETGTEYTEFTLAVPAALSDLPCRLLGLQLQITLNGIEEAPPEELDAYLELSAASRDEL